MKVLNPEIMINPEVAEPCKNLYLSYILHQHCFALRQAPVSSDYIYIIIFFFL